MPSKSMSRHWPSLTVISTLVNSESSSIRIEGCRPTAPWMDRSARERMRRASRIACDTPYRCRRVRKTAAGLFASGPRYSFAFVDHALGKVRRRTSSSMMSSRKRVERWYHSSQVAARSRSRDGLSPVRRRYPATARAKRYRFPVRKRRAFRRIVCQDGKELSGCSAASSFQIDSIWAFEASRYGRRSASRRASADSGSEAVIRSRFWRLEPARGRRAHDDTPVLELFDRGRPREEHRGLQFLDHRAELRHDGVRGDLRGLEHRLRHARHRGAKRDPFRRIQPAPNATGRDERQAHGGETDRGGRRDPPVPERGPEPFFQRRGLLSRAVVLDRGERGPAESTHVDRLDAHLLEERRRLSRDPGAGLLRHDREFRGEAANRRETAFRPPVPFRLDDLL